MNLSIYEIITYISYSIAFIIYLFYSYKINDTSNPVHENTKYIYDFILVLDFNTNPIKKGVGSAIFLHISDKNFKPTKGCIGIRKKDFFEILKRISKKTNLIIN